MTEKFPLRREFLFTKNFEKIHVRHLPTNVFRGIVIVHRKTGDTKGAVAYEIPVQ